MSRRPDRYLPLFFTLVVLTVAGCEPATISTGAGDSETGKMARAVCEKTHFKFGLMDPYDTNEHAFLVANEGAGVLELTPGSKSCKCTKSRIVQRTLEPGQATEVVLAWEANYWADGFHHHAIVRTNDPENPEIKLEISGEVKARLATTFPALNFISVDPDSVQQRRFIVYSHVWEDLPEPEIACTWKGASWSIRPAAKADALALNATSAFEVEFSTPEMSFPGTINEMFTVKVSPVDSEESTRLEIPIKARLKRYISVYGEGINTEGVFEFGVIPLGKEVKRRFYVKVRGNERDIDFEDVIVSPPFVNARLTPFQAGKAGGMFHLDVLIPADAPISYHRKENTGKIKLISNHPVEPEVKLDIDFQIYEP